MGAVDSGPRRGIRQNLDSRPAAAGCVVAAIVVGGLAGFLLSFIAVMETVEGLYRSVPPSQWWLLQARIALATLLPMLVCAGLAVAVVPAVQRRFAFLVAVSLGSVVLLLLFLNLFGVL